VFSLLATFIWTQSSGFAQFETRSASAVPTEPQAIAVGDFNGDGKLDMAVVDYSVTILLGNGNGTFRQGATYVVASEADTIVAAHLRNASVLDLVVADRLSQDIYVLLGNGDGTFQAPVPYPTVGYPTSNVAVGDFNRDGKLDVIVCTDVIGSARYIEVLPGNGDGTFNSAVLTLAPYDEAPLAVAAGQFDSDGTLDVAVTEQFGSDDRVAILLGNSDGTFSAIGYYEVGPDPFSVLTSDFNRDKHTDLAVTTNFGVQVLLGNGDGTFHLPLFYPTVIPSEWVVAEDLDGDGAIDLATSSGFQPAGASVLKGNGNGTFQPYVFYPAGEDPAFIVAADFNGDHQPDLVAADFIDDAVITLLNTGVVSFSPTTPISFPLQLINTTSKPQTVNLTNTGSSALTISSMKVSAQFGVTSTCGPSVAAGATCKISATFSPTSKGLKSGTISIKDSASTKPQVIELTGQGTVVELSPASLTFGPQKVGTKSTPQSVTLTNQGTTALSITQISVGGANAKDFPETNNCPSSLNAGANCTITVTFDPSKTGTRKAQVSITDNGGGSPQSVPLSGTGS
jgi:hypothetical protein